VSAAGFAGIAASGRGRRLSVGGEVSPHLSIRVRLLLRQTARLRNRHLSLVNRHLSLNLVPEEGVVAVRSLREVGLRPPHGTYLSAGRFPRTSLFGFASSSGKLLGSAIVTCHSSLVTCH